MQKGGLFLHRTRGADVVRETRADATWHARPHGSATLTHAWRWRDHASPHGRPGGTTWRWERLASDGPTGIVGPGNSIGTVTQRRYFAPPFILAKSPLFLCVGL